MAIARKALVWGLFAAGGTLTAFIFPALIALVLLIATGHVPEGLQYPHIHAFAAGSIGKLSVFFVIFLSIWHAAHRLRSVFHDFGVRADSLVATTVYIVAGIGTVMAAFYLFQIG